MRGSLWRPVRVLLSDRRAVTAIEYCLIGALILLVVVAVLGSIGSGLQTQFGSVGAALH